MGCVTPLLYQPDVGAYRGASHHDIGEMMMEKRKLQVNVSGGRTSAYMAWWLKNNMADLYDMLFIFANTGAEHPDTYRFLRDVDEHFNLGLVMVESVVHNGERRASTHRVVDWSTLSRNAEPYHAVCAKYGIANHSFPHCTREMKANAIHSYTRELWGADYDVAIGIRADERRRVSPNAIKNRIIYPLVDMNPVDKQDVLDWFKQFEWDLAIPEHLGNCITCFKKSDKKLAAVYQDSPEHFNLFREMEKKYGHIRGPNEITPTESRVFYRGYRSTDVLVEQMKTAPDGISRAFSNDESGGCSESCEPYQMEIFGEEPRA